ncbi:MAG: hypothetical protein ACO3IB_05305 [Phycisphaerales bacterium]
MSEAKPATTSLQRPSVAPSRAAEARDVSVEPFDGGVRGVRCTRSGDRIVVADAVSAAVEAATGCAAALESAGVFAKGSSPRDVVAVLPREHALVGTIELPTDDEAEMRSIARMALARDYSPEGVDSQGDFQIYDVAGRTKAVLAAAPRARLDTLRSALSGRAGARGGGRGRGMRALVRSNPAWAHGATLGVDAPRGAVELALISGGELLHSRGTSIVAASPEAFAAQVVAESRRAVAMLRASMPSLAIARVVVAAEPLVARAVAEQVGGAAGCAAERFESHPLVDVRGGAAGETLRAECWPLAGLLLDDVRAAQRAGRAVDLAHPTPPIDVAARARQRMLAAAGILVVAALAGWTLGARSFRALEERRDDLKEKATSALPEVRRMKRDEFKLAHIDAVRAMHPAWLDHLEALRRFAPDPASVVLDGLSAQIAGTEVEFTRDGKFASRPEIRFVLDGEAKDRETADALRDAFVKEKSYTLSSSGADARGGRRLPYPFAYTLRTVELAPKPAEGGAR